MADEQLPIPGTGGTIRSEGVPANELAKWSESEPLVADQDLGPLAAEKRPSRFPFRPDLNAKIVVWEGDITTLSVDAIVNSTNESLNDQTGISGDIFRAAGGQLEDECNSLEGCRTGEAKSTRAYNLPCQRIIHTAGPRFNVKYRTAAENALHSSYRHSLQVLTELNLRSVGFCCINSEKKGYPREAATHIACRTVRRFLEHYSDSIDLVVFCLPHSVDTECYNKILPLYMPRSDAEEQFVLDLLPQDTGNEYGETVCEERMIRIQPLPGTNFNKPVEEITQDKSLMESVQNSFGQMKGDPDAQRLSSIQQNKAQREQEEKERTYARYLQRAKAENFADIERMQLLQIGGADEMGRIVVVVVAHHFPHSSEADYDRLLLYMIRELDSVVEREFVIVYFHTRLDSQRQPPSTWVKNSMSLLTKKYRKNLKSLLIVHPTMWMKMLFWFLTPFISTKFWEKLVYIDRLKTLNRHVSPELINIPPFVHEHETTLYGATGTEEKHTNEDDL